MKRKKAVNSKWKIVQVVVMQNHKIRSKVETSVKSVGFLSFGSSSPPVLQCLLLLLVSANVLTGCSSAPPPFCSQASLHIFSNKKKKGKRRSGPLPVVVLWRPDFIQAPGSGIISMQMFVVFLFFFSQP